MKKLLLALMLAASSNTMAEWIEFNKDDKKLQTVYVDPTTIHKNGNNVKMRTLSDYKKGQELAYLPLYMSVKRQSEFDCKNEQIRRLYASYHAKHMGEGKVIYSEKDPDDWMTASPDSIENKLWEFTCKN